MPPVLDDPTAEVPPAPRAPYANEATPDQPIDYSLDEGGQVAALFKECLRDARNNPPRKARDKQNWLNRLTYAGRHWVVYNKTQNRYEERGVDPEKGGLPEFVPRPKTNYFKKKIDGISAILDQSEPAKQVTPATDDDADIAAADVIERALPTLFDELGYQQLKSELNKTVCLLDTAALLVYYDTDEKYGTEQVQGVQCADCGNVFAPDQMEGDADTPSCPECGSTNVDLARHPQTQKPIGRDYPIGKVCGKVIPGFELSFPSSARSSRSHELPWILSHTREDAGQVVRQWESLKGQIDTKATKFRSGDQETFSRQYADAMTALSGPDSTGLSDGLGDAMKHAPVVYRLWHDPIDEDDYRFPEGLFAVMVEDKIVEAGPLAFKNDRGTPVKNLLIRQYASAPSSPYGLPPADDLVPVQHTYNLVDALIQLILMHDAAPRVFMPASVSLENEPTGAPGEYVYYRTVIPGEKPTVAPGINPPEALFKYLEILEKRFEDISGLNSVLAGARPEGDPTLGEVQILQERGMSAFKDPLDALVNFETDLSKLLLYIARSSAWSPRFRSIMGENGQWDVEQFAAADLEGNVDITIEPGSAWPKSQVLEMIRLKTAVEMGLFPAPVGQDAELALKLTTRLGLEDLKPSTTADRKQVARKLDRWKQAHTADEIAPPDPTTENLHLHKHFISTFLKGELYEKLSVENPAVAAAMRGHMAQIDMLLAPPAMPMPPAEPGQPAPGQQLSSLVQGGVLTPASAVPQGPPALEAMTGAGVLTPAAAAPQAPPGPSIDDLLKQELLVPVRPDAAERSR